MLRNTFIIFLGGWFLWFWIDKPATGLESFLQNDGSLLSNFQYAFDLAKAGYFSQSYIFLWYAHYLVLSFIIGIISAYTYAAMRRHIVQRRRKKDYAAMLKKHADKTVE